MSADRTVPFDAARVDGHLARVQRSAPAWQSSLRHELGRLRGSRRRVVARLDATRRLSPPQDPGGSLTWDRYVDAQVATEAGEAVIASIAENLEQAQTLLDDTARTTWTRRMFRAGGIYETVLGSLQRARESLYLVEDDAWVRAQLPTLRANVATSMGPDDPRTEGYLRYLDDVTRILPPIRAQAEGTTTSGSTGRSGGHPEPTVSLTGAGVGPGVLQIITGTTPPAVPVPQPAPSTALPGHPPSASVDLLIREQLRSIQSAVDDARMASQIAVRVYRNALVVAILVLTLAALAFPGLAGSIAPESTVNLTPDTASSAAAVPDPISSPANSPDSSPDGSPDSAPVGSPGSAPSAAPTSGQAASQSVSSQPPAQTPTSTAPAVRSSAQAAPATAARDGSTAASLAGIEVWGTLGSAVAVIAGLWRLRSSRQPSGLQLAQLALKIPAGALTALFGVLLLQGQIVLQLKPIESGQIPAYAILFGFAQEALTRFVDGKAGQLLDNAKPLSERVS
jgi:hypothetical protein